MLTMNTLDMLIFFGLKTIRLVTSLAPLTLFFIKWFMYQSNGVCLLQGFSFEFGVVLHLHH